MAVVIGYLRITHNAEAAKAYHEHILAQQPLDALYTDQIGARGQGLKAALASMTLSDCLCIASLSQLGVGIGGLLRLLEELRDHGQHLHVLSPDLDTTTVRSAWNAFSFVRSLREMEEELARERADTELMLVRAHRAAQGAARRQRQTACA